MRMAVAKEPALEEAHAGLMRLYALSGREGEALAQYERLRATLSKGLGLRPSTATKRLRDEIASGEFPSTLASLTGASRENRSGRSSGHNLPAPRTSFVGREREMLEVKRALAMTRLLTLTGAGGSGKTRLALEVARDLLGAYPDGVWLVELAGLSEGTLVSAAVAGVLGVQERAGQPLTDTIGEVLRGKRMLLVLDNCEHLVEEAASLVDAVLDSCPDLRILATSREALGVAGEVRWTVPALSVPGSGSPSAMEELEGYESARLFAERASERRPGFALHSGNAVAVAEICRSLDGIPLAIELAAARTGALAVEEISGRLTDSLELLTDGGRTRSPRQRTLRGALDWSYELLGEEERKLFRRLSVFAGGWTLAAAEVVGAGKGLDGSRIIELLSQLVDKSLAKIEVTGEGVRYEFLEPIRQYAREKLGQSGEAEAVRRRHAAFFLALAEEAEPELRRREQVAWLRRLDDEHDNLRAVLTWSLDREDAELGLRLAGSLTEFWVVRGHYTDGRRWLKEVLAKDTAASTPARAKALLGAGRLMQMHGDDKQAELTTTAGLKLYRELEDRMGISRSLIVLGDVILDQGDLARAKPLLEKGLALSHELGDDDTLARGLLSLGWLAWDRGDIERGKSLLEEGLRISRQIGDINRICDGLTDLGFAAMIQGDYEWATALTEEGLALSRESGNRTHTIYLLCNLGTIALEQGDHERAASLLKESLELNRDLEDKRIVAELIEGIAGVAGAYGEAVRAARLYGAAEALREAIGVPVPAADRPRYERHMAVASSLIDGEVWSEEWAKGKTMELRQAIEYTLYEEERPAPAPSKPEQPSASAQPPILTRREREVTELVARGLTNRRIAEELFVSERTVDHHVSNILKKFKLSSREQVASRLGDY